MLGMTLQSSTCCLAFECLFNSPIMESFLTLIEDLIRSIQGELDLLSTFNISSKAGDIIDRIRLNTTAQLISIKLMVSEKVRLRQWIIEPHNVFNTINGKTIVAIYGAVKNPHTARAEGAFSVVWNTDHKMNVLQPNILSVRTSNSSYLLALLTVVKQMEETQQKKSVIITQTDFPSVVLRQLPLWDVQNYRNDDGTPRPHQNVLSLIHSAMQNNSITLEISRVNQQPQSEFNDLCKSMLEDARAKVNQFIRMAGRR